MAQKPSIPKGTRDFGPLEMARRNYIFDTIRSVFRLYGFRQIETPAMEQMTSLMGKYGEEGDKLLFRIQNSGEKASEAPEKGLRYDLTVPFARYVVQHREELQFPFRRYQIQPVWRADRPQKGRYREFYQCDVDIIGTDSLVSELELVQIVQEVYSRFGSRVSLHLNNRKVLAGIAEVIGAPDKMTDITVAIDKMDKIGADKVNEELREVFRLCAGHTQESDSFRIELDLTLARGLNYYTGAIFEVKALDVAMGSITGGGRYDNLTGIFGLPGVSGVGISFGADRIYDVLTDLNLFPAATGDSTRLLFVTFGQEELQYALGWADMLRASGINTEVYPEPAKMKKQMGYADANRIPFVAVVGSDEMQAQTVMLKNMQTGEQHPVTMQEITEAIS